MKKRKQINKENSNSKESLSRLEKIRRLKMEHDLEFRDKLEQLLKDYNKEIRIIFVDKENA